MATLLTITRSVRGPLTVNVPSLPVPVGLTKVGLTINRFAWPEGVDVAHAEIEFSLDGGQTWPQKIAVALDGGSTPFKGNPDPPSGFAFELPEPANTQRRVRGSVVLNASLDCSATVEAV